MRSWNIAVLVALLGISMLSAQAYRLAYKDHTGDVRTFRAVQILSGTLTMMGQTGQFKGNLSAPAITEKVLEERENDADLSIKYSKNAETVTVINPQTHKSQQLKPTLPDVSILYTRTPLGMVSNYHKVGVETKASIFSKLGSITDTRTLAFPDRDLNIGDSWDSTQELALSDDNRITVNMKYTLTGTKVVNGKTLLVISCECSADIPQITLPASAFITNANPAQQLPPMQIALVLHTISSTLFDEEAGAFREVDTSGAVKLTLCMEGINNSEQTVAMNVKSRCVRTN